MEIEKEGEASGLRMSFFFSRKAIWFWFILLTCFFATTAILIFSDKDYPWICIRYAAGTILVLFLPGYSSIKALLPRGELNNLECLALSLGVSFAIDAVVGLILNFTQKGLEITSITVALLVTILTFTIVGVIRERQVFWKKHMQRKNEAS